MVSVDIAVVGDGLVGRPLAAALSASGHAVALIDKLPDARTDALPRHDLDQRCTALSAGTVEWLQAQRLWDAHAASASPINDVHVSQCGHFGATRIAARDVGRTTLGVTIENRCFLQSLRKVLDGTDIQQLRSRVVSGIEARTDGLEVSLTAADTGQAADCVHARLLIIADGAHSSTAALLGIDSTMTDHKQWATLTTVRTDADHHGVARERFTASGPLALLPRPGSVLSVVACHDEAQAQLVDTFDDQQFVDWMAERMPSRSGRPVALGPRTLIPLRRVVANSQQQGRCVLIGNAARLVHPVAGQGYNLAVRDVASLVASLAGSVDPGETSALAAWLASRAKDHHRSVTLTDTLARVFRGRASLPGHLRAGGLIALDMVDPLRRRFAHATTRGPLL